MAVLRVLWVHPTLGHAPVSSLTVGHPHGPSAPRPTKSSPPRLSPSASEMLTVFPHPEPQPHPFLSLTLTLSLGPSVSTTGSNYTAFSPRGPAWGSPAVSLLSALPPLLTHTHTLQGQSHRLRAWNRDTNASWDPVCWPLPGLTALLCLAQPVDLHQQWLLSQPHS